MRPTYCARCPINVAQMIKSLSATKFEFSIICKERATELQTQDPSVDLKPQPIVSPVDLVISVLFD